MKPLYIMTAEELWSFWAQYWRANRKTAKELVGYFPGYTKAVRDLANYACNRSIGLQNNDAMYLNIAERIYQQLPQSVKVLVK